MLSALLAFAPLFLCGVTRAWWPVFPGQGAVSSVVSEAASPRESGFGFGTAGTAQVCSCLEELHTLDTKLRTAHGRLENFQRRMDELSAEMYNMQNGIKTLETRPLAASAITQDVSFSARVGTNRPYLKDVDTIIFDDIIINNAGAYDPYSGKFTAPATGVYHLTSTILSGFNSTIETMFVVNGEETGRLYSGAFNNRGSGSNNILVNLKQGDEVSVNVFYGNGNYVHGQWSTFSGFLVKLFG